MSALVPNATELALVRTELAHERTLMAWVRTSFSMISFGFTIFKFFQYVAESELLGTGRDGTSARNFGIALILLGTGSLVVAILQHRQALHRMKDQGLDAGFSLSLAVASLITVFGALALVGAFVRTGIF